MDLFKISKIKEENAKLQAINSQSQEEISKLQTVNSQLIQRINESGIVLYEQAMAKIAEAENRSAANLDAVNKQIVSSNNLLEELQRRKESFPGAKNYIKVYKMQSTTFSNQMLSTQIVN